MSKQARPQAELEDRAERLSYESLIAPGLAWIIVWSVFEVTPYLEVRESLMRGCNALNAWRERNRYRPCDGRVVSRFEPGREWAEHRCGVHRIAVPR